MTKPRDRKGVDQVFYKSLKPKPVSLGFLPSETGLLLEHSSPCCVPPSLLLKESPSPRAVPQECPGGWGPWRGQRITQKRWTPMRTTVKRGLASASLFWNCPVLLFSKPHWFLVSSLLNPLPSLSYLTLFSDHCPNSPRTSSSTAQSGVSVSGQT